MVVNGGAGVDGGGIGDSTRTSAAADDVAVRNELRLDFDAISSHEPHQHRHHHHHHSSSSVKLAEAGNNPVESSDATKKPKVTRRRKGPRAQSIEEVFATISSVRSSGLNPPQEHIVLTPRSAEACLRCGVNPETLKIRDLESFYNADVAPAVQRMRHEAYSMRRHEEMKAVRLEKKKIIEAEDAAVESPGLLPPYSLQGPSRASAGRHRHQQHGRNHDATKKAVSASPPSHSSPEKSDSKLSMLEVEKRRLEKVKARQERELEQMLDFEIKMSKIQQDATEKAERERRLGEQRERERVRFAQEMAEEKRQREIKKRAQMDAEEERRKLLAAEMAQRDRELAEQKAKQERLRRLEARDREEERKAKADEHRLMTEEVVRQQQLEIAERLQELDLAEKARNEMVEQQRLERAREMEERRRVVTLRIRKNLKQSKKLELQRKREIKRKQHASEQLRQEHEAEQERQRELARKQQEMMERKRLLVIEDAKREEERKKEELLQRQREMELNVHQLQATQQQQLELKKEYRRIQQQLKLDKVERMKRIQEYKRLEALRKMQDTEQRTQAMLDEKDNLVKRRKQIAVHAKIQRDLIMRTMENVKITKKWSQASKTIEQVMGKASSPSSSPTRSLSGRPKSSSGAMSRQTSLPTISRPHTPSAGVQSRVFRPPSPPPTRTAFKFTREAQEEEARGRRGAPQSYLSPYDQVPDQIRPKKLTHVRSSVL
ncbi:hypothetical protein PybrP1_005551 [[Pythium] brassicae (nom. inval.)]|nr:hypothetical protein PybrP1_005551 [[Pythium] brassicae (nom. inval.)]